MNTKSTLTFFSKPVSRKDFIRLIKAALSISEYRFARQASLDWLASFPGDLELSLIFAKSLVGEGKFTQAIPVLEKLCSLDPEYEDAFKLLDEAQQSYQVLNSSVNRKGVRSGLKSNTAPSMEIPEWKLNYFASQKALVDQAYEDAERLVQKALVANPASPIPAIHQMNIFHKKHDFLTTQNLAEVYHQRWPECLQFTLYLTESYLRSGDEARAVSLLHHCVALDSTGQVVKRLWGINHPYKNLWPERMEIKFSVPIPANVAMVMGWNQLQPGPTEGEDGAKLTETNQSTVPQVDFSINDIASNLSEKPGKEKELTSDVPIDSQVNPGNRSSEMEIHPPMVNQKKPLPEDLASVQTEFAKIAKRIKQPQVGQSDGRFPVFVLLSSRTGLEKQYGAQTTNVLDLQMKNLAALIQKLPGWESMVFCPDDPAITAAVEIKPILVNDPWKIKLSLADLDNSLSKKGQRIGAILIVGGPEVVPFHHLPNPTDDSDPDVPSDNPYATSDENYFVPEWPVGRLLGEAGSDPGMLLEGLRKLTADYTIKAKRYQNKNVALQFLGNMNAAVNRLLNWIKQGKIYYSFGYSARVWQDASSEVYKTIGQPKLLMTSPPVSSISGFGNGKLPARLAYYNLHGIQDGPEWYGQKCPEEPESIPDYPVALSPKDIQSVKSISEIIFSEACYGAYLNNQKVDDSIALKVPRFGNTGICRINVCILWIGHQTIDSCRFTGTGFLDLFAAGPKRRCRFAQIKN